jgi:hypothetical protein
MRIKKSNCPVCKQNATYVYTTINATFGVYRTDNDVLSDKAYEHDGQGFKTDGEVPFEGRAIALIGCSQGHLWKSYVEGMNS